ncbi:MAG: PHP domain-containing protein [Clostridia bacterium]|nr:PHP domain-containing protein [Clostridia bacterium]
MGKFELHVHTAENDLVAQEVGANIVKLYKDIGYDGVVITDHYFAIFYDWFKDELEGKSHREIIDRWLKGYRAAKEEGEKCGFTVLLGAEVRFDGPMINDYLVYGIDEEFLYNAPLLNRLDSLEELLKILPENAVVVQAHPFRDNMTVKPPENIFGIEVYNGGTQELRNKLAKDFARYYNKPMTSGSDFHDKGALGKGGIITKNKINSIKELVSVLKSGDYTIIES